MGVAFYDCCTRQNALPLLDISVVATAEKRERRRDGGGQRRPHRLRNKQKGATHDNNCAASTTTAQRTPKQRKPKATAEPLVHISNNANMSANTAVPPPWNLSIPRLDVCMYICTADGFRKVSKREAKSNSITSLRCHPYILIPPSTKQRKCTLKLRSSSTLKKKKTHPRVAGVVLSDGVVAHEPRGALAHVVGVHDLQRQWSSVQP